MILPLRRYIANRLSDYYSQPSNLVIGSTSSSVINYENLLGEWHWRRIYKKLYDTQQGQWLTPVELFRPYYSHIMAEYIIQQLQEKETDEFEILELGGGRGTNAEAILSYLRLYRPEYYDRLYSYTIVDASVSLQKLQRENLLHDDDHHKLQFSFKDLTDIAESKTELFTTTTTPSKDTNPTFVLGLEVLDNLGHDKVRRHPKTLKMEYACIQNNKEVFKPIPKSDRLLRTILSKLPSYGQGVGGSPIWIPSVACGVLMNIANQRPTNSHIIIADFDYLPQPDILPSSSSKEQQDDYEKRLSLYSHGEPLVTDMKGKDYICYLNAPQYSDILYPTNFNKLAMFCKKMYPTKYDITVRKQHNFLSEFGRGTGILQATTSRWTGYNPMIQDFVNCSVLTINPK